MSRNHEGFENSSEEMESARRPIDDVALQGLVSVIREVESIRALEKEADATIERYAEITPSIRDTLLVPQSSDKHGEGPFMEDHLRLMVMHIAAIAEGKFRLGELPEFVDARTSLPDEDLCERFDRELEWIQKEVREHRSLFELFALHHDIAKPDTTGYGSVPGGNGAALGFIKFDAIGPEKKQKETETERLARFEIYKRHLGKMYRELMVGFAEKHPELVETPAVFQRAFFAEYGITLTHLGHAPQGSQGEHRDELERAMEVVDLPESDRVLLPIMIEHHINAHLWFLNTAPKDFGKRYQDFLRKMDGVGGPPAELLRALRAAALFDLLATKKDTDQGLRSFIQPFVDSLIGERMYEPIVEALRFKEIMKAVGFDGDWIQATCNVVPGPDISIVIDAVESAATGAELMLPPSFEPYRSFFLEKIEKARALLTKE